MTLGVRVYISSLPYNTLCFAVLQYLQSSEHDASDLLNISPSYSHQPSKGWLHYTSVGSGYGIWTVQRYEPKADLMSYRFSGDSCNGDPGSIIWISSKGTCIPTDSPARHSFFISEGCSICNVKIHVSFQLWRAKMWKLAILTSRSSRHESTARQRLGRRLLPSTRGAIMSTQSSLGLVYS
jgi:hypothetical protein